MDILYDPTQSDTKSTSAAVKKQLKSAVRVLWRSTWTEAKESLTFSGWAGRRCGSERGEVRGKMYANRAAILH